MTKVTIATVQFTSGNDIDANFARMAQRIDDAADAGAQLVAFQEFCNHPSYYTSQDHAWQSAIHEEGAYVQQLADKARERGVYVFFNATVRRQWPTVEDQNFLISAEGELVLTAQKQILMGGEQDFYDPGAAEAGVVDTPLGRIGLMSCMEGLIPETPRVLAVQGADIILNSLSSNGIDEAHTHIPVRAAENGLFVVSSNRSGPLVDAGEMDDLAEKLGFPTEKLVGGGESQIVGPDGVHLARARAFEDDMVVATIDLADLDANRLRDRRPDAYGPLTADPAELAGALEGRPEAGRVHVAAVGIPAGLTGDAALREALERADALDAELLVLPELFAWDPAALRGAGAQADTEFASYVLDELVGLANRKGSHIVAGVPGAGDDGAIRNRAVLVGPQGVVATYDQVHVHADDQGWATPGAGFVTADLPFGRVGLLVGNDLVFPESARVLALLGVDLIAAPTTWRREWESGLVAPERSAENRVALVAAARTDSPTGQASSIFAVPGEYRFPKTGEVNMPDRLDADGPGENVSDHIDLAPGRDKRLMKRTDLLGHRQPALYGVLTRAGE